MGKTFGKSYNKKTYSNLIARCLCYEAIKNVTDEESLAKMEKLLDALENNDDVQKVWHNLADNEEQEGE